MLREKKKKTRKRVNLIGNYCVNHNAVELNVGQSNINQNG